MLWVSFFFAIIATPDDVDKFWKWSQQLELVPHTLVWVFCFPYMLATATWVSDIAAWLRVAIVVAIPIVSKIAFDAVRNSDGFFGR